MQYEGSTHARHWIFNMQTLRKCRQLAVAVSTEVDPLRARKFASDYHNKSSATAAQTIEDNEQQPTHFSVENQEAVIRFHVQQLEALCGPTACLEGLRTSERVLFAAITLVRRFYLSNSVLLFHPRHICLAAVFLAGKVEEEKIELCRLSHATLFIRSQFRQSPLYCRELSFVTTTEIECAEKVLMEGINYELISHPATNTLREVAQNLTKWIRESVDADENGESVCAPNSFDFYGNALGSVKAHEILRHFMETEKRALMYTDVAFLFNPSTAGLAIAAVALGSYDEQKRLGELIQDYLVARFPLKTENELIELYRDVNQVITMLIDNPLMGICPCQGTVSPSTTMEQALIKAEQLRISLPRQSAKSTLMVQCKRKASIHQQDSLEAGFGNDRRYSKLAKITP